MNRTLSAIAITLGLTGLTVQASAQDDVALQEQGMVELSDAPAGSAGAQGNLRLYGGLRLGFGGETDVELKGVSGSFHDDLLTTFGGQVGADYVVMDYFAIGGELRLASVTTEGADDADADRTMFIDAVVKPRGRYALADVPLELYGTLPLGVTFINLGDDVDDNTSAGPGFTLGVGAGATYFFTDNLGINAEMAYLMYWFGTETDLPGPVARKTEADTSFGQFSLFANLVYAL